MKLRKLWNRFILVMKDCRGEGDLGGIAEDIKEFSQKLSVKIGGTTYLVSSFLKQGGKSQSTALDKIQRLIEKDASQVS